MIINVDVPHHHPDGQVASCYVWRDRNPAVLINVHIEQARAEYPNEPVDNAIQGMASQIFKFKETMAQFQREKEEREANNEIINAFHGYE